MSGNLRRFLFSTVSAVITVASTFVWTQKWNTKQVIQCNGSTSVCSSVVLTTDSESYNPSPYIVYVSNMDWLGSKYFKIHYSSRPIFNDMW